MLLSILLQMCAAVQPAAIFAETTAQDNAPEQMTQEHMLAVQTAGVPAQRASRGFIVFNPVAAPESNEISRADDGLFYVNAVVNGAVVRFIVDTGATTVVLTAEDARRAGFLLDDDNFTSSAQTAAGTISTTYVTLPEIVVGDKHTADISAAVVRDNLTVSLLGQNWLNRMDGITISRDKLVIH